MHKIDYSIPNDSLDKTDGDQHSRIDENVPYRLRENLRFMKTNPNSTASLEPSTNAAFAERVRVNQAKLTSELRPHYDFIVCGHFLHVSSAIIGKHRQRSDVTGITTSSHRQIGVASTSYQPNLETSTSNAGAGCGRLVPAILDKASIQPQQTSDHQTNIVQQVMSTGGELHGQSNAK
jgi:hypothetical protein